MDSSKFNIIFKAILFLSAFAVMCLQGCARIPLTYIPGSAGKFSGSVSVANFRYLPAENGQVQPFQIRNTALGSLKFNKNIDIYFKDAVAAELDHAGIKLNGPLCVLSGEIEEFLVHELGSSIDWTLKVNYAVRNRQTGNTVYTSEIITRRTASKLVNVNSALNEMIKLNIEELLKDNAFIKTIN